jgi:hypothetical protein
VTIEARAGVAYTVVIDGFEGAASAFTLQADCAGGWPAGLDPSGWSAPDRPAPREIDIGEASAAELERLGLRRP